jgi:protein OPY2
MHLDNILQPRQSSVCISCPDPPPCNCNAATETCFQINRGCNTCSSFKCVPLNESSPDSGGSHGVSKGALAGGIAGALLFFVMAVLGLLWYRRRRATLASGLGHVKEDIPAPASTVLNRPDPTEKPSPPSTELSTVRVYSNSSNTTIDLDPESQSSTASSPPYTSSQASDRSNPFTDYQSIQTTGTDGTNVIPIALVAPPGSSMMSSDVAAAATPMRPIRSPELNLDHVNISHESLRAGAYGASSQRSGVSGVSSRNSYMSNAC